MSEGATGNTVKGRGGRPRSFDRSVALKTAMLLFWERGYAAVSISDLTTAMGITTPSLYSAFGSKAHLYLDALQLYNRTEEAWTPPTNVASLEVLRSFFDRAIRVVSRKGRPHGCMVSSGFLERAPSEAALADEPRRLRQEIQSMLASVIRNGVASGDLPQAVNIDLQAMYLNTVLEGLTVQARDEVSPKQLRAIAKVALEQLVAG